MVVGEIPEAVDLLVVGGGPGGYVAAIAAAQLGRNVVLVDADGPRGLGGACVRVGCIPSKALIELANRTHSAATWAKRGVPPHSGGTPDMAAFQQWKEGVVDGLNHGVMGLLRRAGVQVRHGYFRFTRPDQGALAGDPQAPPQHLQFRSCVIATGSRPAELAVLPRDGVRVLDSTDLLAQRELPASVAVIGAGYIGVELGTALAKLGTAVTLIEAMPRVLPTMPDAASAAVTRRLGELGVILRTGATVAGDDGHAVLVDSGEPVKVDRVVVAAGRVPNTHDLGLDALGVTALPGGSLPVGADRLLTPNVAAIGDITPGPALAHKASAEARVAVEALSGRRAIFDPAAIPNVVFADPEVAQTGLTLEQARQAGVAVRTATFPVSASGRARTLGEDAGLCEWVVETSGIVRGALVIGPHASDLVAEATLAIEMGAHLEDVAGTIHPHPTMSELLAEAALVGLGRPVHVSAPRQPNPRHTGLARSDYLWMCRYDRAERRVRHRRHQGNRSGHQPIAGRARLPRRDRRPRQGCDRCGRGADRRRPCAAVRATARRTVVLRRKRGVRSGAAGDRSCIRAGELRRRDRPRPRRTIR